MKTWLATHEKQIDVFIQKDIVNGSGDKFGESIWITLLVLGLLDLIVVGPNAVHLKLQVFKKLYEYFWDRIRPTYADSR